MPTKAPEEEPMKAQPSRDLYVRKLALAKSGMSSAIHVPILAWPGMSEPS
ncbi:hypothetical protein SAVIM40S_01581 [Streptomyces avidinii]